MRRTCLVLVVLILCAAAVFAGGKREEGVTTLTIAGRDGAFGTAMDLATQEYTRQNPNVRFEILKLSGAELMEQTVIELRGGTGAFDVLLVDDPFLPRIQDAGWLVNLDDLYREQGLEIDPDLVENMVNVGRYPYPSGDLYALPHVGNVALFAYRHDIASRYGYSAIDTWSDVLDIARRIDAEGDDTVPVLFRGVQGNPIVTGFLPIFWAFGADILVDGKPAFDTPEALAAVEFFLELAEYAPAGVTAYQATQVRDALLSGAGAMAIEVWPGWIGDLENPEQSDVVGKVSIAAHPGQVKGSSSMIGAWMVGIPRDSRNIDAAFDFIQYLTSAPVQEMMADKTGIPPTRHSVHHIPRLQEKYPWYPAQLAGQISGSVRPRTDYWPQIETVFGDYLQRALVGEVSAQEALQQIQRRVTEVLR
ncbi:extracellular solute-binding protein [Alkalispirochaeta alkalica]|uniref:extracellular solute-binding protein n=1 Tax=Alkalispirochaeta alkalica TaxID=46356 RepID=UPI000379F775|nr:extracellular solute-binding protein [Alkalispirochaeta alkalica]